MPKQVFVKNKACLRKAHNQLEKHQMGFDGEHIGEGVLTALGRKGVKLTRHKHHFDILTAREAWEVKTVGRDALHQMSVKAKQKLEKLAWAKAHKLRPKSMMVIINDMAEVYVKDGIGKFRAGGMKKVKVYKHWRKDVGHGRVERLVEGKPIKIPLDPGKEAKQWGKNVLSESERFQEKFGLGSCGPIADNIADKLQAVGRDIRVMYTEFGFTNPITKEISRFTHYVAVEYKKGRLYQIYDPSNPFVSDDPVLRMIYKKGKFEKAYPEYFGRGRKDEPLWEILSKTGRSTDDGVFNKEMVDWWKRSLEL